MKISTMALAPLAFLTTCLLVQGLLQIIFYMYVLHAQNPATGLFQLSHGPLWAGSCNIVIGLICCVMVLSASISRTKRLVVECCLLVAVVSQTVCWMLAEFLEFERCLELAWSDERNLETARAIWFTHALTTALNLAGDAVCVIGLAYLHSGFFRRRCQRPRDATTARSWNFLQFSQSTLSGSNRLRRCASLREKAKISPITDEQLNRSAPLRLIAMFNPEAVFGEQHQSPDLQASSIYTIAKCRSRQTDDVDCESASSSGSDDDDDDANNNNNDNNRNGFSFVDDDDDKHRPRKLCHSTLLQENLDKITPRPSPPLHLTDMSAPQAVLELGMEHMPDTSVLSAPVIRSGQPSASSRFSVLELQDQKRHLRSTSSARSQNSSSFKF